MTTEASDDLPPNGRERLIEAAIRLFGRDGFEATSVRAVADKAEVSWGLIRFYFGSKDGLREAAEARVVEAYMGQVAAGQRARNPQHILQMIEAYALERPSLADVSTFLRRAVIEGRPIAQAFIASLVEESTRGTVADLAAAYPDEDWLHDPARRIATRMGYLMIAPQLEAALGRDVFSTDELKRRNLHEMRMWQLVRLGLEAESKAKA